MSSTSAWSSPSVGGAHNPERCRALGTCRLAWWAAGSSGRAPGTVVGMGLVAWVERLLARQARPTGPAKSVFGVDAEREAAERDVANEYEFEVEKGKGRHQGF